MVRGQGQGQWGSQVNIFDQVQVVVTWGDPLSLDIQYRKHPCYNKTINEIQNELYGQDA